MCTVIKLVALFLQSGGCGNVDIVEVDIVDADVVDVDIVDVEVFRSQVS